MRYCGERCAREAWWGGGYGLVCGKGEWASQWVEGVGTKWEDTDVWGCPSPDKLHGTAVRGLLVSTKLLMFGRRVL